MASSCICKSGSSKDPSCLGHCDMPKHKCVDKEEARPGRIPKNMGWLYNSRESPEHQLRCGWRPGHISCTVLQMINYHKCIKDGCCYANDCSACRRPRHYCSTSCIPPSCCRTGTVYLLSPTMSYNDC